MGKQMGFYPFNMQQAFIQYNFVFRLSFSMEIEYVIWPSAYPFVLTD